MPNTGIKWTVKTSNRNQNQLSIVSIFKADFHLNFSFPLIIATINFLNYDAI